MYKILLKILSVFFLISIFTSPVTGKEAEKYPASWKKTMTNNLATNTYLKKFTKPLQNSDAETIRIVFLSILVMDGCEGSSLNKEIADNFLKSTGYYRIEDKDWDNASFLTNIWFHYFDYRSLAHLCAGSDYLFGTEGKLVKNLIQGGKGEPTAPMDEKNPYIRLHPLPKPEKYPARWKKNHDE